MLLDVVTCEICFPVSSLFYLQRINMVVCTHAFSKTISLASVSRKNLGFQPPVREILWVENFSFPSALKTPSSEEPEEDVRSMSVIY